MASTQASLRTSAWSVVVMRGVVALCLALLCLARLSATLAFRADLFGAYALADGILCGLAVCVAQRPRERASFVFAGAIGIAVGGYLVSSRSVSPVTLALALTAWGGVVGFAALAYGYTLYRGLSGPWRLIALRSGVRLRRGATTERGLLLAGACALALVVADLALDLAGATVSLTLVTLFAAVFGYLHLRVGLTLGLLAQTAASSGSSTPVAPGDLPELEGGPA